VLSTVYRKDLPVLEQWCSKDIQWDIAGRPSMQGLETSADGQSCSNQQSVTHFSHVIKFASAGKAAKITAVRSYFVEQPGAERAV